MYFLFVMLILILFSSNIQANQIFRGYIDNHESIIMSLSFDNNDINGFYYYGDDKEKINIDGKVTNNSVVLRGFNSNDELIGTFDGELITKIFIKGIWKKVDEMKKHSLEVCLYINKKPFYYGGWIITKYIPTSGISAMTYEEAQDYVGMKMEFNSQYAKADGEIKYNPKYNIEVESEFDFLIGHRISPDELDKKQPVLKVDIDEWINIGSLLIVKDSQTLITLWNGIYFELKRCKK